MANKLPVLDEANQGIKLIDKNLIKLNGEVQILEQNLVRISKLFREIPKNQFDSKTPREANIPLEERSKLLTELQGKVKLLEQSNRKLTAAIERKTNARRQGNVKTSEEIVNNRILARNANEQAILNSKLTTAYQKLTVRMTIAGRTVQSLNAKKLQGISLSKKEQDQLRKSEAQFARYNRAVLAADVSINRFQRNVGNYGLALKGLAGTFRSLVGALGVTSGVYLFVGILRSGLRTLRDFGASMANLAGIFRVTREDLAPLEADIIAVAGASVKTATEVAKLAEALATLGKSKEEISDLLEPVNNLSIGLGATSEETAEFLVQTINAFGGSTKEALKYADTIATIRTSTSLNFQKMRDSFQYLTPISQILNKDLAYTGALIGIVADSGIKAERAGRLLGTAQQKLAKEGSTLAQALEEVNEASARGIKEEKLLAIASNLFGKQAASLGIILAQNSDIIETNAQAIRDNGGALDDLVNEQLKSLDASLLILRSRWEQYILNTDESSGSSQKLTRAINFLADNLGKIIDTIITVVKTFVAYKLILIAVGAAQKIATGFTIAYRIALIAMNRGVLSAIRSLGFLRAALIKTGIGAAIVIVGALVVAFKNMNKSISEIVKELTDLSEEFLTQYKETQKVNNELDTMIKRHDELKGKTNLNAKEQAELNTIIETIGKTVPDAVTEIDRYGNALEINTAKVKEFTAQNKEASLQLASINIKNQTEALKSLELEYDNFTKAFKGGGVVLVEGLGLVKRAGNDFFKVAYETNRLGESVELLTELTRDEKQAYFEKDLETSKNIKTLKDQIKLNQAVVNSITGVTDAQEEQNKVNEDAGNKIQPINTDNSRASRGVAYNTKLKELEDIKALNQEILNNEKSTEAERLLASLTFYDAEKELLDLNRALAIKRVTDAAAIQEKGGKLTEKQRQINRNKLFDIDLKYDRDVLNNEQKREDAAFKILETSFKSKLKLIKDAQNEVRVEMQAAIDAENKIFLESERTPKDVERLEKAILKIRQKYAIEELKVALEKTEALAAAEQDPLRKAELLRAAAILESSILQLQSDQAIDILKSEAEKTAALEKIKQDAFDQTARVLADSLGLSEEKLSRFFEALSKESSGLEKIGASLALIGDIGSAIHDKKIQEYEYEIEANNEKYEALLENENLSKEQREALETERDRKNTELEEKQKREKIKQFNANKIFAIGEVAINTAIAVSKAVALSPLTGGLPFSAVAIALGAVQIAAIASKQPPRYKRGRTGGDAEFAYVGDGGISEIIARSGGGYEITPNRETLTYLNKGDSVLPDASKFLHEQAYNMSISAQGRSVERIQVNNGLTKKDLDNHAAQIVKAMSQNKTSVRVHNNNSIGADLKFLNKLNDVL